jgi:hypothetical protein
VVEGLPDLIPLPLLFGESKYTNPQVRWFAGPVQLLMRVCHACSLSMRCAHVRRWCGAQPAVLCPQGSRQQSLPA